MTVQPADTDEYLRLLAKMSDDAPVSITVHDFDGTILYANEETFRLHGFTREEFLAKNLHEIDVPGSEYLIDARMQQIKEKGEADFEVKHFRKDGSAIPLHVNIKTMDWGGRKVLLSFATDITERKQAEEQLHEAVLHWHSTFDSMQDATCLFDADQRIIMCNRTMLEMVGAKNSSELIGRHCWEVVHGTNEPIPGCPFVRMRGSLKRESMELQIGEHWFVVTLDPILDEARTIVGAVHNIRDITERKLAEEVQHASEIRYRRLFEAAQDGILILDAGNGQIVDANPFLINLLGFSHEQFLGKKIWDIGVFKDVVANKDNFEELQRKESIRYENLPLETADGRNIAVEFVSNVYIVDNKKVIQCNIRDITERKLAEDALIASEIRYRRLFEAAQDGILILDAGTGQIVDANPFLINLLGFSHEQFLGKKIWEIGIFKDVVANKDNFKELQRKESIRYENLPLETADGHHIDVEFVSNVYVVNHARVIQCNIRDITERKLTEDRIRILNEQLTAESAALNQTQDELRALNDRLEDKVRKRTAELKQVNLMLTERNLSLQVMNAGTRALLIVQDEAGFMPQICNDLVRIGVYSHVWLAGVDTDGKVGIVATAGDEYPEFFRMLANGQLPACTDPVRKTGGIRAVITPDPACAGCPLFRLHTDCSTIVVRLDAGEKSVGLLGVTLQPGISATGQENERIVQIAQEIAFVILHLRTKELEQRAFNQITKNLEQLAILNDNIRNPLQGIVGYAGIGEGELFTKIIKFAMEINSIVTKLDEGYLKSKKIRDFMERHEHISYKPDRTSDAPAGKGTDSPLHPPG